MKRYMWAFYFLIVALLGCAHLQTEDIRARNIESLKQLEIGMTEAEVGRIMGVDVERVQEPVYYQGRLVDYQIIEVRNPYRAESRTVGDKTYRVVYYYAEPLGGMRGYWDRSYREAIVPDECLTPLVFEHGRLIGLGREFADEKGLLPEFDMETTDWMFWGS